MEDKNQNQEIAIFKEYEIALEDKEINLITSEEFFKKFQQSLKSFGNEVFDNNEQGRKRARELSRTLASIKINNITKGFDDIIKQKELDNEVALKEIKSLKDAKKRFIEACDVKQKEITKIDTDFKDKTERQFNAMKSVLKQYQSLEDLKNAKQSLCDFYGVEWEEKRKDAEKLFTDLHDKLVMQEATIAQLEKERAERQALEAKHKQEKLEREREAQERLIREQAERLTQGKEIELPPVPTPAPVPITTPQQQSYAMQVPAKPDLPKEKYTLFFDTETTSPIPTKARIVQIGALVLDDNGNELERLDVLVKQDSPIPPETIDIHGKTDAMCAEKGIPLSEALQRFKNLIENVDFVVAHNMPYDETVIKSEFERIGQSFAITKPKFDTMVLYKDIVKCPPTEKMIAAGFTAYKAPKLDEAFEFVFGKGFDNAHDALSDVIATAELFNHYKVINKKVVSIMTSNGISQDQARLIAKMLSREDLTLYTQYDTLAALKQLKEQQAEIERLKAELESVSK